VNYKKKYIKARNVIHSSACQKEGYVKHDGVAKIILTDYLLNKLFNILTDTIMRAWFTKQSSQ
jgi:hypothetical protein